MNTLRAIVATEAKRAAEGEDDLTERVRKCMKASLNHWMATDEEDQFAGAIAAAMSLSEGDDLEALEQATKLMNSLGALISGVPVDLDAMAAAREEAEARGIPQIKLMQIWNEVKAE